MASTLSNFMGLYAGRTDAYGTGKGEWVRSEPTDEVYAAHLRGEGPGLGIAPLFNDGTVRFAAIDLDDDSCEAFEKCREMQRLLPGVTWIERSRSGNAHLLSFFSSPIQAWIPRGIFRQAINAVRLPPNVEVFPKQDKLRPGSIGNYLNLSYYGDTRPVLAVGPNQVELPVDHFVEAASLRRNEPGEWGKRARWLLIDPPEIKRGESREFGTAQELHICAQHIIEGRHERPVREGHRNVVYFSLAKALANYSEFDHNESFDMLRLVRDAADEEGVSHASDYELHRILRNAEEGKFTSTGCDDPLMTPYVHPDCKIARNA